MVTTVTIPRIIAIAYADLEPHRPEHEWQRDETRRERTETATVEVEPGILSGWMTVNMPGIGKVQLLLGMNDRLELARQLITNR